MRYNNELDIQFFKNPQASNHEGDFALWEPQEVSVTFPPPPPVWEERRIQWQQNEIERKNRLAVLFAWWPATILVNAAVIFLAWHLGMRDFLLDICHRPIFFTLLAVNSICLLSAQSIYEKLYRASQYHNFEICPGNESVTFTRYHANQIFEQGFIIDKTAKAFRAQGHIVELNEEEKAYVKFYEDTLSRDVLAKRVGESAISGTKS